jgi:hypothetical protein
MWVGDQRDATVALPLRKDAVPTVEEAGWAPRAGLDGGRISSPTPGFDLRTVQPVAIRYTD